MKVLNKSIPFSYILILPLCILLINSHTILLGIYAWLKWSVLACFLIYCVSLIIRQKKTKLLKPLEINLWLLCVIYLWCGLIYSIDKSSTIDYCISVTIYSVLLIWNLEIRFYEALYKVLNIFLIICMVTIYINAIIHNLMTGVFSFLIPDVAMGNLVSEVDSGVYSGIFADRANAAFAMNIGFAISYSNFLQNSKKRNIVAMVLFFVAIFFTGKRMLSLVPIVMVFASLVFKANKKKTKGIFLVLVCAMVVILIAISFFPQMSRFLDGNNGDLTNSRSTVLWPIAFLMFNKSPFFGLGLNTFNSVIQGQNHSNETLSSWSYNAHNIYVQFLGELGIVGAVLLVFTFVVFFIVTVRTLKKATIKKHKYLLTLSMFLQVLWLMYGYSGNTFYYSSQLLCYILALGTMEAVKYEQKKSRNLNIS